MVPRPVSVYNLHLVGMLVSSKFFPEIANITYVLT
jgi:hypothetical protein